jgi:ubiquinone/menaquinone biosynthesis C-methylase UbiE
MEKQSLYRDLAPYYDLIYTWKDYKKEVDKINKIIARYKKSNDKDLLEVACGTGHHLQYFKQNFSCTGTDINQGILNVAKKKTKNVIFKKADMINMNLNKNFDVITCLFSSIGYVKTYTNLQKTLKNFANHLKTGGVVIIEPWFTKSAYKAGSPHMITYESKDLKIARLVVSKVKGNVSEMDMHYLIAERNKEVKHFVDRHELGLFEIDKTLQFMKQAGLKTKYLKSGLMKDRGLFIGVKE